MGISRKSSDNLMQEEKILFDGEKITLQDPSLTDDRILNKILYLIINSQDNKTIEFWLHQIVVQIKNLREIMIERLKQKGYLQVKIINAKFGTKTKILILKKDICAKLKIRITKYITKERRSNGYTLSIPYSDINTFHNLPLGKSVDIYR